MTLCFERTCQTGLVYGNAGGEDLLLDLYLPEPAEENEPPRAAVLYIHGGGWVQGSRAGPSGVAFALEMSAEGLVVASIDYRLAPKHPAPAAIEDCKLAVRWLKANCEQYNLDPDRILAMGNSAGGHLAAMVALARPEAGFEPEDLAEHSSSVMAALDLCGITDVAELIEDSMDRVWAQTWIPADHADRAGLARRCSPIEHAHSGAPPMLIVHGDADPYVPYHQSVRLARALKKAGAEVEHKAIAGAGHFLSITGSVGVQKAVTDARRRFFTRLGLIPEPVSV